MPYSDVASKSFEVVVAFDDTYTRVRIFTDVPGQGSLPVAEGTAKRMKGDPRDSEVGIALATGRAFEALAKRELDFAEERLNPTPPQPPLTTAAVVPFADLISALDLGAL